MKPDHFKQLQAMTLVLGELYFNLRQLEDALDKALEENEKLQQQLKGGEDAGN